MNYSLEGRMGFEIFIDFFWDKSLKRKSLHNLLQINLPIARNIQEKCFMSKKLFIPEK